MPGDLAGSCRDGKLRSVHQRPVHYVASSRKTARHRNSSVDTPTAACHPTNVVGLQREPLAARWYELDKCTRDRRILASGVITGRWLHGVTQWESATLRHRRKLEDAFVLKK